ncbi:hypothetical protein CDL12_02897 [Handroanthus impetiginosus]|uniref:Uncharacterized protein n=1 Tax=Handroanthus impetiginosus TaxID=429701 RepID=A0A2G9I3P2_9LAMI|nr:hypothetical protein CDL12_02897 [Handroanthus impetiginosus]
MRRTQILSHFLLMWLIWVAFQQHYAISSSFQESKSVSFKINAEAYNSRVAGGNSRKTMRNTGDANENKVRKTPSGPSPVGNHRPPSRG